MFFQVNSQNRHSVRKLLTGAGMDSAIVRNLRNGQLGKSLFEHVKDGKIAMDTAAAACSVIEVSSNKNSEVDGPKAEITSDSSADTDTDDDETTNSDTDHIISSAGNSPASNGHDVLGAQPSGQARAETLGAANQMASILENLMRQAAPKAAAIDADQVRAIVADVLKTHDAGIRRIDIQIGETVNSVDGAQHVMFDTVVKISSTRVQGRRLHTWLVGPSGSGKSFLAGSVAKALGLKYYSTSAIQSKYDLIGFVSPTGSEKTLRTPFRDAFEFGGVFAWDDIDASDPRAFVAFNEALSNGRFAFPDGMVEQHPDFVCIASANTWGNGATADYVGRNKIDGATLSRFVRVSIDYDEKLEREMVGNHEWARFIQRIRSAVKAEGIKVLVTPRHTLQGVGLLAAGLSRDQVESMTVFAGLDTPTVERLRRAA